jgi:hypothetical protein
VLDAKAVGHYSGTMKRNSAIRPQFIMGAALLALVGCGPPNDKPITSPNISSSEFLQQSGPCLIGVFDRIMTEHYVGMGDASIIPTGPQSQVVSSAIDQCVVGFDLQDSNTQWVFRADASVFAMEAQSKALKAWSERRHESYAAKAAESQAKLKAEEPAILAIYRNCIFASAARLAVVSEEPAEVVVRATYAACRPQRMALIDLHKRYDDSGFDDERMDRIEDRVAGALMLTVMRARAEQRGPPPTQIPPASTSPPSPDEHSI